LLQAEEKVTLSKSKINNKIKLFYLGTIIISLIIVVIYAYSVITVEIYQSQIEEENRILIEQKRKLEEELKNVRDPKYIEQQARTQLKMIFPGEILYIMPEETKENNEEN
jgi:cell division protein DivIC